MPRCISELSAGKSWPLHTANSGQYRATRTTGRKVAIIVGTAFAITALSMCIAPILNYQVHQNTKDDDDPELEEKTDGVLPSRRRSFVSLILSALRKVTFLSIPSSDTASSTDHCDLPRTVEKEALSLSPVAHRSCIHHVESGALSQTISTEEAQPRSISTGSDDLIGQNKISELAPRMAKPPRAHPPSKALTPADDALSHHQDDSPCAANYHSRRESIVNQRTSGRTSEGLGSAFRQQTFDSVLFSKGSDSIIFTERNDVSPDFVASTKKWSLHNYSHPFRSQEEKSRQAHKSSFADFRINNQTYTKSMTSLCGRVRRWWSQWFRFCRLKFKRSRVETNSTQVQSDPPDCLSQIEPTSLVSGARSVCIIKDLNAEYERSWSRMNISELSASTAIHQASRGEPPDPSVHRNSANLHTNHKVNVSARWLRGQGDGSITDSRASLTILKSDGKNTQTHHNHPNVHQRSGEKVQRFSTESSFNWKTTISEDNTEYRTLPGEKS